MCWLRVNTAAAFLRPSRLPQYIQQIKMRDLLVLRRNQNVDKPAATAFVLKLHDSGNLGVQRVILADADVISGLEARTPLPDNNRSPTYELACKSLHAEPL